MKIKRIIMGLVVIALFGSAFMILRKEEVSVTPYVALVKERCELKEEPNVLSDTRYTLPVGTSLIVESKVTYLHQPFYKVYSYFNNDKIEGYISPHYLKKYTFDEDFENQIRLFPYTYKQSLRYLHCLYNKWEFLPYYVNLDFNKTATIYQKNALISTDNSKLYANSKVIEGTTWRRANIDTVKYYLDPRNNLRADRALMFERLVYSDNDTKEIAESMLEDTYMVGKESTSNKDWSTLYVEACQKYNISLANVISRAIVEQSATSTKEGSLGSRGKVVNGVRYYNIFNIGARTGAEDGIEYAAKKKWDTREKAILGGVSHLASRYIKTGQSTLYLQRFDINYENIGTHCYMTNVMAQVEESRNLMKSYQTINNVNSERTLSIPVYNKMSSYYSYPDSDSYLNNHSLYQTVFEKEISECQIKDDKLYDGKTELREHIDYEKVNDTYYGLNQYIGVKQ